MKLAILDKDGTLTQAASGATFPQHPKDQVLLPGVEEAVAQLVADGYTLVVASNQGGCEAFTVEVSAAKAGMVWLDAATWFDDDKSIKLDSVFQHETGIVELSGWSDSGNGQRLYSGSRMLDKGTQIKCCWKTVEEAIAEMRYCMELVPAIHCAYFCPDFAGKLCYKVSKDSHGWRTDRVIYLKPGKQGKGFRKPEPGMLLKAISDFKANGLQCLMVGDQECDLLAAKYAGVEFMLHFEWVKI